MTLISGLGFRLCTIVRRIQRRRRICATRCSLSGAALALMALGGAAMGQQDRATPLHAAAATGDMAEVRALLAAGVAVDAVDRQGRTALLLAVEGDRAEIARVLLDAGASPNARSEGTCPSEPIRDWHFSNASLDRIAACTRKGICRAAARCCPHRDLLHPVGRKSPAILVDWAYKWPAPGAIFPYWPGVRTRLGWMQ